MGKYRQKIYLCFLWHVIELIKLYVKFIHISFSGLIIIIVQKPWYATCGMILHNIYDNLTKVESGHREHVGCFIFIMVHTLWYGNSVV